MLIKFMYVQSVNLPSGSVSSNSNQKIQLEVQVHSLLFNK
jgi:hypothetical protein